MDPQFTSVDKLPVADAAAAAAIKAAAIAAAAPAAVIAPQPLVTAPGVERWPVKTGTDADESEVKPLIVDTTVEELVRLPRPADMIPPTSVFADYQNARSSPVETTVWRLEADIIALKLEADGDYHLVLQGDGGETMIAEIPTPKPPFVAPTSPWLGDITAARQAADDKLVNALVPASFRPMDGMLMPLGAFTVPPPAPAAAPPSFVAPGDAALPTFQTKITPTRARLTGVGFFDAVHGQSGVAVNTGIELHPVLEIEWL